jgi:hypothetical protein
LNIYRKAMVEYKQNICEFKGWFWQLILSFWRITFRQLTTGKTIYFGHYTFEKKQSSQ